MLRIDISSAKWVVNLHCAGRLIYGVEVEMLRSLVQSRSEATIHVDLSSVTAIDAAGLGLLVELHQWAKATRRTLTLINLSEPVWRMVIMTKLCAALDISSTDWSVVRGHVDTGPREMIA